VHGNVMSHGNDEGAWQRDGAQQRIIAHDNVCEARQRLCCPYLAGRMAKDALPGMALSCAICRASTHANAFAVSIVPFAVPLWRTTTKPFPVVHYQN
jgi:hypothetical protein